MEKRIFPAIALCVALLASACGGPQASDAKTWDAMLAERVERLGHDPHDEDILARFEWLAGSSCSPFMPSVIVSAIRSRDTSSIPQLALISDAEHEEILGVSDFDCHLLPTRTTDVLGPLRK